MPRALALVLASLLGALLPACPADAQTAGTPATDHALPRYRVEARLDTAAHTLTGTVTVTLPPGDPRLGDVWWFHLPPNRFATEDPRGSRRWVNSLRFDTGFQREGLYEPDWPDGVDTGHIEIHTVRDENGGVHPFRLAPNETLPQGYAVNDALMRVELATAPGTRTVRIDFTTVLPERYWNGWSDAGVLADAWYPSLAAWRNGQWDRDAFTPRGALYEAEITVSSGGNLFLGAGHGWRLEAGEQAVLPLTPEPLRALPLVFVPAQRSTLRHDYDLSVYSYYAEDHERLGQLALEVGERFRRFMGLRYGLAPPYTRLTLVEVDLPPRDPIVVGGLVLVPTAYYRNAAMMDRLFVAHLARTLAQVWFGEAVWSNRDTQSWLHLGVGGYLALEFFAEHFGPDAGVHNVMDWLQPKYREHFYEVPVRQLMRGGKDAPLMISLTGYPEYRTAMLVAYNKAPLVLRTLEYVVGREAFARALHALHQRHRGQVVTEETLRATLESASGQDLRTFFANWFHDTPRVDFSVQHWEQTPTDTGYRVTVQVRRDAPPKTPVTVRVSTQAGQQFSHRWEDGESRAELAFALPEPALDVAIDPSEYWLELDRKNNRSDLQFRWRPLFDWSKQRDLLIAVRGTAGGNSTDGNYYGLGVNATLNENNHLRIMPIYGDRTGLTNYQLEWNRSDFLTPGLELEVSLSRLGGGTSQRVRLKYAAVETDHHGVNLDLGLNATTVRDDTLLLPDGSRREQARSRANNVRVGASYAFVPDVGDATAVSLYVTDSRPAYDSDYTFTTARADAQQDLSLGVSHLLSVHVARATTVGAPPLQMRTELGGPSALRGYPRVLQLTFEEIALGRLEYGYVVTQRAIGSAAQVRRITTFLFAEAGRGWDTGEHYSERPRRQDAGVGIEFLVNLVRLNEVPLRLDLAYPLNDEEYRDPQWILFGLLSF